VSAAVSAFEIVPYYNHHDLVAPSFDTYYWILAPVLNFAQW